MADAAIHGHEHDKRGFFTRWFMSTNHKDIGILYLFTGGLVGLISVIFTVYMRMELMHPGVQYMCLEGARFTAAGVGDVCTPNGHIWNVLITAHGSAARLPAPSPWISRPSTKTSIVGEKAPTSRPMENTTSASTAP